MARLHDYSLVEIAEGSYYINSCVHGWALHTLNRDIHSPYFWLAVRCVAFKFEGRVRAGLLADEPTLDTACYTA